MNFRITYIKVLLLFFLTSSSYSFAQDPLKKMKKRSTTSKWQEFVASFGHRKQQKQKWKEDREEKMFAKKAVKEHHKRLQSKSSMRSMRENKKKSDRYRRNGY